MRTCSLYLLSLALAATACGGKNSGAAKPAGAAGEGDDVATPFNDATVKAALSSKPGAPACTADASTTIGAHFAAQRATLTGGDPAVPVSEMFTCRARADDNWDCEWAILAQGSRYAMRFTVAGNGTIAAHTIACDAPAAPPPA